MDVLPEMTLQQYLATEMARPDPNPNHIVRCVLDPENHARVLMRIRPLATDGPTLWFEVRGNEMVEAEAPAGW
jgi:hypothetical protein